MATTRTILRDSLLVNGRDPARAGMSVTIRGDRIEAVEPDERVASSSDDVVHDLAGRAVMPGMVQSHFHSHFGAFGEGGPAPTGGGLRCTRRELNGLSADVDLRRDRRRRLDQARGVRCFWSAGCFWRVGVRAAHVCGA